MKSINEADIAAHYLQLAQACAGGIKKDEWKYE
jgi:hypothetical protein